MVSCEHLIMGSAATHEFAEDISTEAAYGDRTVEDALWSASLDAVEAAIAVTAASDNSCSSMGSMAEELLVEVLQRFCTDAIEGVPLPKPWSLQQDDLGHVWFLNVSTGDSQWDHPLGPALAKICALCRAYFQAPLEQRADLLAGVQRHWESQAKREYSQWYSVEDEGSGTYYCHKESDEVTWDHPSAIVLPQYYMLLRAISRLGDDAYVKKLCDANMDVCIQCVTDTRVYPAGDFDARPHHINMMHFHSTQIGQAEHQIACSSRKSATQRSPQRNCADTYFIGDCPGTVPMAEKLQLFDLTASDDALETQGGKVVRA